jgi:hypothetical protein
MDIYVDTEVLSEGINGIVNTIQEVSSSVSIMKSCLSNAGDDFDTANYDRASGSLKIATDALNQMEYNLEQAKGYLSALIEHIEAYDSFKY